MQYFVRSGALAGFVELVSSLGGNPISILNDSHLLPSQLDDPDTMIPYEHLGDVLELAANRVGMAEFGARLSRYQGLSTMGLLGAYMMQQKNIEASLLCARKFTYMHAQGVTLGLNPIDEDFCRLSLEIAINSRNQYPQMAQLSIGLGNSLIQEMMGGAWKAETLTLTQLHSPVLQKELSKIYGCEVALSHTVDSLIFPLEVLQRRPVHSANLVNDVITRQFMHMHSNKPDMVALIRHAINVLLPTGDCSKENVALSLNIHTKKLERILSSHQLTYRTLLEQTRRDIAVRTLEHNQMALTNLALNLGYSDFSAFSRSFKQWFGVSPTQYRQSPEQL